MGESVELVKFQQRCFEYFTCYYLATKGLEKFASEICIDSAVNADPNLIIATGPPGSGTVLSKMSAIMAKDFSLKDGVFSEVLAQSLIIRIYAEWDELYRHKVAEEFKVKAKDVSCDLMGDLRLIRHWIVHKKCIVGCNFNKIRILKWNLCANTRLIVSRENFRELMERLNDMQVQMPLGNR